MSDTKSRVCSPRAPCPPHAKVAELINQAALETEKDSKLVLLKQVATPSLLTRQIQELIVVKEPAQLDNFFEACL